MKLYGLIDCNNFFASCERIFRPDLEKKPIAVLSNNDGCIIARSNEVKKLGVPMGMPLFKYKNVLDAKKVHLFSSNFALYGDISKRVMQTLSGYSKDIQVYSIDEAFLEFSPTQQYLKMGKDIRKRLRRNIGIPSSIGFGPTKTVAKLAGQLAKKSQDGVVDLTPYYKPSTQDPQHATLSDDHVSTTRPSFKSLTKKLAADEIWGIGSRCARRLARHKIFTVYDFIKAPERLVKKVLNVGGLRTQLELKGVPCLELNNDPDYPKSILSSRSFGQKLTTLSELKSALSANVVTATQKLRKSGLVANTLVVFIRTSPHNGAYYSKKKCITLPEATDVTPAILHQAVAALEAIYKPGKHYAKSGILLTGLHTENTVQPPLFGELREQARDQFKTLMTTIDEINARHKKHTIIPALTALKRKKYQMNQQIKSPRYTTEVQELCNVF